MGRFLCGSSYMSESRVYTTKDTMVYSQHTTPNQSYHLYIHNVKSDSRAFNAVLQNRSRIMLAEHGVVQTEVRYSTVRHT
jgi:hypothetical protein